MPRRPGTAAATATSLGALLAQDVERVRFADQPLEPNAWRATLSAAQSITKLPPLALPPL